MKTTRNGIPAGTGRARRHARNARFMFLPGLLLALLCGACDPPPPPSVVAPLRRHLDRDGDGRVSPEEYDRVRYGGPAWSEADGDGDGDLSVAELEVLFETQDPLTFDDRMKDIPDTTVQAPDRFHPDAPEVRALRDLLLHLAAVARAREPSVPLPSREELSAAAATGDPASPEVRSALSRLREGWKTAGLAFPAGLVPAAKAPPSSSDRTQERPPG